MKSIDEDSQIFLEQQKILGYKDGLSVKNINRIHKQILIDLCELPENKKLNIDAISEDKLKELAKIFYDGKFNIHNVMMTDENISKFYVSSSDSLEEANKRWDSFLTSVSPYDIPIIYTDGHSMIGKIDKVMPIIQGYDMKFIKNIPFLNITLGDNLTLLSVATYIHEIVHSQIESVKGSIDNYHNKEVLSIFMEKLAASELDSSGNLLKLNEMMRFSSLRDSLAIVYDYYLRNNCLGFDYKTVLENSMYIESTLKAMLLFENYENATRDKNRRRIIYGIQDVFDGKINVEDLLLRNTVNENNSQNINFIRKRIKNR